jgi:GAF domain-containing protein
MAESIQISDGSRKEQYEALMPQVQALLQGESDLIANMANMAAAIREQFGWLWVGFYRVLGDELVLGPFQGPIACTRIKKGQGVCGHCRELGQTVLVPDVHRFPGHIACSSRSNSEIVVPLFHNNCVAGVLDIDSELFADFDETDRHYLEQMVSLISF